MKRAPAIFVSHGLPPMALLDDPYNSSLINFGRNLELKGIVCVSSLWMTPGPIQVATSLGTSIQHNFQGFQKELYDIDFSPAFSEELLKVVNSCLDKNSWKTSLNPDYGFDHGIWMPLRLINPEGTVPVVQISLPYFDGPRKIMQLGSAFSALREEGILIMGSGNASLNTSRIVWHARDEDAHPKISAFDAWLVEHLLQARIEELIDYKNSSPHAEFAHPGMGSLLPLFFIMGSSLTGDWPQIIYRGIRYSTNSLLTLCLSDKEITRQSLS